MNKVTLVQATPDPIGLIARVASVCYDSKTLDPMKIVKHLYRNGHESVFEHVWFTFHIEGISRACSHQLVRHRMCSFTQRSQRYCNESHSTVVLPRNVELYSESGRVIKDAYRHYEGLVQMGVAKEDARYVLPNAAETEIYVSCNLRELIHMCEERLCVRAQKEIREVVEQMTECVDKDLRFMLKPRCGNPRYNCLEKGCRKQKERNDE